MTKFQILYSASFNVPRIVLRLIRETRQQSFMTLHFIRFLPLQKIKGFVGFSPYQGLRLIVLAWKQKSEKFKNTNLDDFISSSDLKISLNFGLESW